MKCSLLEDYRLSRTFVSSGTEKYRAKVTPNNHAGVGVVENQVKSYFYWVALWQTQSENR